jgi:hypothetical protein
MGHDWNRCVSRANQLADSIASSRALITFYGQLLDCQRSSFVSFDGAGISGSFESDLPIIAQLAASTLKVLVEVGPATLSSEAQSLLDDPRSCERAIAAYWREPTGDQFFAKTLLQPYLHWLAAKGLSPQRRFVRARNLCPSCGGPPQVSILTGAAGAPLENGGGRQLQCASCLSTWSFRRVVCPACGEEEDMKLVYFLSAEFDHVRIDACDTCHRYLKTVDLRRLGLAVPLVDEAATAALDAWAVEHGYEKIELNLLGL